MSRPTDWEALDLDGDPTPGDPFLVRQLARRFLEFAADVEHARGQVSAVGASGVVQSWVGAAGDAYRDELDAFPGQLAKLEVSYRLVGQALDVYGPVLDAAQVQADRALARGREARARCTQLERAVGPAHVAFVAASTAAADLIPVSSLSYLTGDVPPPDPDQIAQALRNRDAARVRWEQAQEAVASAQGEVDAARRLALAAQQMRAPAAATCVRAIRDASDAGIRNRPWWSWEKMTARAGAFWTAAVQVAKVTTVVLGVVALVIGGPVAWMVFAAGLVVLVDVLARYGNGGISPWDVGFALLGCIPGGRGLTTAAGLVGGVRAAGQMLRGGRVFANAAGGGTALAHAAIAAARTRLAAIALDLGGSSSAQAPLSARLRQTGGNLERWDERLARILDPKSARAIEMRYTYADDAYKHIRSLVAADDVARVAKSSGVSTEEIAVIRNHLFLNRHFLDDGFRWFDSDPDIADAWRRLQRGEPRTEDLDLLRHELYEARYETANLSSYREAHAAAIDAGYAWKPPQWTPQGGL